MELNGEFLQDPGIPVWREASGTFPQDTVVSKGSTEGLKPGFMMKGCAFQHFVNLFPRDTEKSSSLGFVSIGFLECFLE